MVVGFILMAIMGRIPILGVLIAVVVCGLIARIGGLIGGALKQH